MPVRVAAGSASSHRPSRAGTAHDAIRRAILSAEVPAGEPVNEVEWAQRLGMSRTPIREALSRLAQEGLVERVPNRGTFVRDVSLEDLRDIYQLRVVLEAMAAADAVRFLTEVEIAAAEESWSDLARAIADGESPDYETVGRLDSAFHMMIVNQSTNARLRTFMHGLSRDVLRYQLLTARLLSDVNDTIAQHLALTRLLTERDAEGLAKGLKEHIENAANVIFSAR
jgi:DNA-binding GntR family transcriptional regulator